MDHWFEALASHLGSAYLRYSFTKGTVQEIDYLVDALGLGRGDRVLDVGCGPGRHAHELARRGIEVHGIDISAEFISLADADAPEGATFERLDARSLTSTTQLHGRFSAAICLCQGAFGLMTDPGDDAAVLEGIRACLAPGAKLALSAFNAYFAVRYHEAATFDAASGVSHERTDIIGPSGERREVDLWTGCFTPRELQLLLERCGFSVWSISSVEPGNYGAKKPSLELPEFLVIAAAGAA